MPFMLKALVGRSVGISLPAGPLLKALVETLLIPLVLGKVRRVFYEVIHASISVGLHALDLY